MIPTGLGYKDVNIKAQTTVAADAVVRQLLVEVTRCLHNLCRKPWTMLFSPRFHLHLAQLAENLLNGLSGKNTCLWFLKNIKGDVLYQVQLGC